MPSIALPGFLPLPSSLRPEWLARAITGPSTTPMKLRKVPMPLFPSPSLSPDYALINAQNYWLDWYRSSLIARSFIRATTQRRRYKGKTSFFLSGRISSRLSPLTIHTPCNRFPSPLGCTLSTQRTNNGGGRRLCIIIHSAWDTQSRAHVLYFRR